MANQCAAERGKSQLKWTEKRLSGKDWVLLVFRSDFRDPNIAQPSQILITDFVTATIGGKSYDPETLNLNSLFDAFGDLNASAAGSVGGGDSFIQFTMTAPDGGWSINFAPEVDQNGNPAFIFTNGQFSASAPLLTPEPATVDRLGRDCRDYGNSTKKDKFRHGGWNGGPFVTFSLK